MLSLVNREAGYIQGIMMHDVEFKAQYADDTTVLEDKNLNSIINAVRILKWFKTFSVGH